MPADRSSNLRQDEWRAVAFRRVARLLAAAGAPVALVALAINSGIDRLDSVVITAVLAVVLAVAILSRDLRRWRALAGLLVVTLIVGCLTYVPKYGVTPGVALVLGSSIVLGGVFLGGRAVWCGTAVTTLLLLATGVGVRAGLFHPDPSPLFEWNRLSTWLRVSAVYLFGTTVTAATVAALLARLERSLMSERQARAAAERAVAVREEFLLLAAHELRTPVTSLRLALQALSRRAKESRPGEVSPFTTRMIDVAERQTLGLVRLVNTLLDVSTIDRDSLPVTLADVDLTDAVRTGVAQLSEPLRGSGSALKLDIDGPITGLWDRVRLQEVVVNLLSNAIKYGEGQPIEVGVRAEPDVARLVVRDHGIGIAPEDQGRLFKRFERAAPVEHYGGLGLGLYVVKSIVERLGGTVDCESSPHEGSTFTVALPRGGPRPRSTPAEGRMASSSSRA
jgi:signal transduction histidine kinase